MIILTCTSLMQVCEIAHPLDRCTGSTRADTDFLQVANQFTLAPQKRLIVFYINSVGTN